MLGRAELRQAFEEEVTAARDACKIGGSTEVGKVHALTALALATYLNEPIDRVEISGSLTVDN